MKIAVSACLLGHNVRYDGGDKHNRFVTHELGRYASFVPFCPEAIAFGTPRPSVKLVEKNEKILVITNEGGINLSKELLDKANEELQKIIDANLSGIIFKARSPSCGLGSAKVYQNSSLIDSSADGIFAALCREKFPLLPMEDESGLEDENRRENFIVHLFAYNSIEKLKEKNSMHSLEAFHAKNKFLLQAKDEKLYRLLKEIVLNHKKLPFAELFSSYEHNFKVAIAKKSSILLNQTIAEAYLREVELKNREKKC